jgi:hypothetical protein
MALGHAKPPLRIEFLDLVKDALDIVVDTIVARTIASS